MAGKTNRKQDNYGMVLVFLICLLPRVIGTFRMGLTTYVADELSTMSTAAILSGQNWSHVLENIGYYGGGMTMFLTPLFSIIKNPIIVYHIMLIFMCLLQSAVGLIAWHILGRYFYVTDLKTRVLISIASSYMVTRRANNVTNEHMLILLTWVIIWILLALDKNEKNKKNKAILSVVLAIVMAYALTVHERGKVYVLALFCLLILYAWVYRKCLISILPFGVIYLAGFELTKVFKNFIISNNWPEKVTAVRNSEVSLDNLDMLFHLTNWRAWISCILGQLTTISLVTGGIFIIALILVIVILEKGLIERKRYESVFKKEKVNPYFIIYTFLFAAIGMTILGQSISWLSGLVDAYEVGYDSNIYELKALTYIRYFGIYVGPVLMITLLAMYESPQKITKYWKQTLSIGFGLGIYWMGFIWPYISGNKSAIEAFLPFSLETKWNLSVGSLFYLLGIGVLIGCLCLTLILLKFRKSHILLAFAAILLIYQYGYNTYAFDEQMSKAQNSQEMTYRHVLSKLEENFDVVYVSDTSNNRIYLTYQMLLYNTQVIPTAPEKSLSEGILISNNFEENQSLLEEGWKLVNRKDNEEDYVFVKGEETQQYCEEHNLDLVEYQPYTEVMESFSDSDGEIKTTINGELTRGTYNVKIKGKDLEQSLQEVSVISQELIIVESIGKENFKISDDTIELQFSIPQNYVDAELVITPYSENKLMLSEIVIEKISGKYNVGMDRLIQMQDISATLKKLHKIGKMAYLNNDFIDLDFSWLKKNFPDMEFFSETELSLYDKAEDIFILVPENGQEWMALLQNYVIVGEYENYVLLATRTGVNGEAAVDIPHYSQNGYISLELFRMYQLNGYKKESYSGLRKGTYQIIIPEKREGSFEGVLSVQIVSNKGVVPLEMTEENGNFIGEFSLTTDISEWHFETLAEPFGLLDYNLAQIAQVEPASVETYRTFLKPLMDTIVKLQYVGETNVYTDLLQLDILTTGTVNVKTEKTLKFNSESVDADSIIIPNNIDEIFNLLNRYDVVDSTESYTLLMKKDILEKLLQLSSEVTALSYQGNLNAKYYEKSSGNAASFYAPYGNYAIEVEVTIPEYVVEGDMGYVELWGNNTILSTQNVEVQRQEILQGKKRISMEAASLNNLNSIYVSAFGKNYAFQANLVSIKKVSDTYKPSLSQLCVSGIELHDEMIISDNVKDACISTGILEENVGVKYTYTYLYKAKEPEVSLYLFNTETEKTILKTNKVEKVEDGLYRSQIVVKPSEDRYIAEMILKISSAQDFQLLEVDVKKEYENP